MKNFSVKLSTLLTSFPAHKRGFLQRDTETTLEKMANLRHTLGLIEVSTQNDNLLDTVALLEKAENETWGTWESVRERRLLVFYRHI